MFSTILSRISYLLVPLLAGALLLLTLQLLWRLLRRAGLLRGLDITTLLLSLLTGLALFLDQADLLSSKIGWGIIQTTIVALLAIVVLHVGEALLLLPYQQEGRRPPVPRLMRDIVRAVLFILTVLFSISQFFSIQLGTIVLSSTVLTAIIGLALQDLLKNVFSGIALELEHPFGPGDWILVDGQEGEVVEMSWRAIRIRTRDGTSVILPNGVVSQQRIANFTTPSRLQARHLRIPIDSNYPPSRVQDVLTRAALATPGVVTQPAPVTRVIQFSPATTTYDLKYWLDDYAALADIESNVMCNIWYHMRREDITFATTELVMLDPSSIAARLAPPSPEVIRETLSKIDLFAVLGDQELHALAHSTRVVRYGRGEVLMRQGAVEDTLFVIQEGLVRVEITGVNSAQMVIKHLRSGSIIGEFGLLTGEPRSATVIAEQDTVAIVIKRSDLAPILERNPTLPEMLGRVLERRSTERTELLEARRAAAHEEAARPGSRGLARRIRDIFALLEDL